MLIKKVLSYEASHRKKEYCINTNYRKVSRYTLCSFSEISVFSHIAAF